MLNSIKNKTKGLLAYFIVGLIIIPFALFGVSEYFIDDGNTIVASVDGIEISQEEFLQTFNTKKRRLQQQLAEKYNNNFDAMLQKSVLNQMIEQWLLNAFAAKLSHVTTPSELNTIIQTNDLFKDQGKFSLKKYKQLLRTNGYSTSQYEQAVLKELTQVQIKQNLLDSAFVVPSQLDMIKKLTNQQRQFNYMVIDANHYKDKVTVSKKSIKDFYDKQKKLFITPEQVKLEFVELSPNKIAKTIRIQESELLTLYQQEQNRFSTEEERQAQHILLTSKTTANKVLNLLNQGGSFAKLTKQYSKDVSSKNNAGDLGFFTRGVMVPEFEKTVFNMKKGEISNVIKSEFGYHIIKLNKIKASTLQSFAEVKPKLVEIYTQKQIQKLLYQLTEQLANLAYEESLEVVAQEMNLSLKTTEFFDKNNTKLSPKIITAAFSDVVLNKGENSTLLELPNNTFMVVRLKQKLAPKQQTFDEIKSQIKTDLTMVLAKTFIDNTAQKIVNLLTNNDNDTVNKLIKQNKLKWIKVGWIKRNSNKADTNIIRRVFTLTKPTNSTPTYSAQSLTNNSTVIINLLAVKAPNSTTYETQLEKSLLNVESNELFIALLETLKSQAKIELFEQN